MRVYRGAVTPPDAAELEALVTEHMPTMQAIFNPNRKRFQARVHSDHHVVRSLVRALHDCGELEGRVVGNVQLLRSLPGCQRQRWHLDYDPTRLHTLQRPWPCGVLFALESETLLDTYEHGQYRLAAGDVLVFDADVIHAGSAYAKSNTRMHMYLDTADYRLTEDATFLLNDGSPDGNGISGGAQDNDRSLGGHRP